MEKEMKKEYTEPTAEKLEFEYTESVVACDSQEQMMFSYFPWAGCN